jgi:FkbM family methyltransferase
MRSEKEKKFLNELFDSLDEDIVCFDIGANKGFYTKALLTNRRDKINKVYCFEPVETNLNKCIELFSGDEKVDMHQKGCFNENKKSKFYKIISDNLDAEGLSSLNRRGVFGAFTCEEIEIDLIVLEDFLTIPSNKQIYAKIDVEGFELEVMMGMDKFFRSNQIHSIQFEYGNCILERGKNLNDIISLINQYPLYKVCDYNENLNEFIVIDDTNIVEYIYQPWSNLYIVKI